jgi:hypothetical protein
MRKYNLIIAIAVLAWLLLIMPAVASDPVTFEFGPGTVATVDNNNWGGYNSITYPVIFDGNAGPITIEIRGLNLSTVKYTGALSWPATSNDTGAFAGYGLKGSGNVLYQVVSPCNGKYWDGTGPFTNSDGYRKYLFQGSDGTGQHGNHQFNVEKYGNGSNPSYDTVDIRFIYSTDTPNIQAWNRLRASSAWDNGNRLAKWGGPWNIAINTATPGTVDNIFDGTYTPVSGETATANGAWVPMYDGPWNTSADMSAVKPYVFIQNWAFVNTDNAPYSVSWENLVVTGIPVAAAGMITGGGWFIPGENSIGFNPDGSKAHFGFNAKANDGQYSGQLEFQYKPAMLNLKSTNYDWVAVSSPDAFFQGQGTVNGAEGYNFWVSVSDTGKNGGPDYFIIRIWKTGTIDNPDYLLEGNLGGGQIVVH